MNLEYKYLLEGNFHPQSRVWIYQANRVFSISEALEIEEQLQEFVKDWKSHGTPVKGAGYLFFGQFVILMADESATGVSGCSTDSSVRLIKSLEQTFGVTMFDRMTLAFVVKDKIELLPMSQMPYALDNGFIDAETLYFNNLVETKEQLENEWIIPLRQSWLSARFKLADAKSKV
jgi:hypothetical protein